MVYTQEYELGIYEKLNPQPRYTITKLSTTVFSESYQNLIDAKKLIIKRLKGIYKDTPLSVDDFLKEKYERVEKGLD